MEEVHQKLVGLLKRRNTVISEVRRLEGSLESAEKRLASVKEECRKKGVEPEKLDATIESLSERYILIVEKLEEKIVEAEETLASFVRPGETAL